MTQKTPTLLCILDGLGINPSDKGNAVVQANTKTLNELRASCPNTTLRTDGLQVGLPEGQMGNSEVGHLNIGAGRVVKQWLVRISDELENRAELGENPKIKNFLDALESGSTLHLLGLFSTGGVHSHCNHLFSLLSVLTPLFPGTIALHLVTDGRDVSPHESLTLVRELESTLKDQYPQVQIASIAGRFFTMDRDKRWERTEQGFQALIGDEALPRKESASSYIEECYEQGTTDEFIPPAVINRHPLREEDGIIFWNFRADRMRQIVSALSAKEWNEFERGSNYSPPKAMLSFTEYSKELTVPVLFESIEIKNYLGEVISERGLTQIRVAETEKYPHVTYFLNGGSERELPGEDRALLPSPRDVRTYDEKPEMSAEGVKQAVLDAITSEKYDLIVVNFANCDMVGHTGDMDATVKAVEVVDQCLGEIVTVLKKHGGQGLVIADHGNAEQMRKDDGSPHTAHTTFPVPCILIPKQEGSEISLRSGGKLADVAPTILALMGIEQPKLMTGSSLLSE